MTTTDSTNHQDIPFTVQDRRRKGFFTIDNELLDHYGAQLGPYGLVVYMALARFANNEGACWPSLSTIAKKTGMSRPQVIREIAKLKETSLIAVEHQVSANKEYSSNIYILLDFAVPAALEGVVSDRDQGSISEIPPLVSHRDQGSIRQRPKQNIQNNTQHQNNTEQINSRLSPVQKEVVVVLTNLGFAKKVASQLARNHSQDFIAEKIAFLEFLQSVDPSKVKNPRGWLRRAIEEDYAPPDGFMPQDVREQLAEQESRRKQAEYEAQQDLKKQEQEVQEAAAAAATERRQRLYALYATAPGDIALWQELQQHLAAIGERGMATLLADTEVLGRKQNVLEVGVWHEVTARKLSHPKTPAILKKHLKFITNESLDVAFVVLEPTR